MENRSPVSSIRKRKAPSSTEAHREITSYPAVSTDGKAINLDQKSYQLKVFNFFMPKLPWL